MNGNEYRVWFGRMTTTFPTLGSWLEHLQPVQAQAINYRWKKVLERTDLDDANKAIDEIAASPEDSPWRYDGDKERAAAIIARRCNEMVSARKAEADKWQRESIRKGKAEPSDLPGMMFRAIAADQRHDEECQRHRSARGRCRIGCNVAQMVAAEMLAAEGERESRDPSACRFCEGDGVVICLQAKVFTREFLEGGPLSCSAPNYATACHCQAGQRLAQQRRKDTGLEVVRQFEPSKDVWLSQGVTAARVQANAWVESLGGKRFSIFDQMNGANCEAF